MSHVTAVKINIHELKESSDKDRQIKVRVGSIIKQDLIDLINKTISEDPTCSTQSIILDIVKGYHIGGQHRHAVKDSMRFSPDDKEAAQYNELTYWHMTLSQIYVGLSPGQARYLAKLDNALKDVAQDDSAISTLRVSNIKLKL